MCRIAKAVLSLWMFTLALTISVPTASAQIAPTIESVSVNTMNNTITINGGGFNPVARPIVNFGGTYLVVQSFNRTTIVAKLGAVSAPGTYLLTVADGILVAFADVTLGSAGTQGPQGPPGPAGPQGPAGAKGATGPSGAQGQAGSPGAMGAQGPAGPSGPAGPQGAMGLPGAAGAQGPAGPAGAAGATGPAGTAGATGATGAAGANGATGATGAVGATGATGAAGATGATGAAGATGATGAAGPAGATGATGTAGAAGATGATGAAGATGPAGPTGATGSTGATGATGPSGTSSGVAYVSGFQNPGSSSSVGAPFFVPPVGFANQGIGNNTGADGQSMPSPIACTLSGFTVAVNNYSSPGSDTSTLTVYVNGAATSMSCSVTTNANKSSCSDTTHTLSIGVGDLLAVGFYESNPNPFNALTVSMSCQ
jgi:hypothetical protein